MTTTPTSKTPDSLFTSAEWYERTINWSARLAREIPVLMDVLGPPGSGGIIDAGCGTGHQAVALAERGYRVVGSDLSEEMLAIARRTAEGAGTAPRFVATPYAKLHATLGDGFDGLYCLGNALAATGSREGVREAIGQFAACLRTGGRLFVQILNFAPMRATNPCVRGPRVCKVNGVEYISVRQFHFGGDAIQVTNVAVFNDGGWKQHAHSGTLYPITQEELQQWCGEVGLRIDALWSGYERTTFDVERSVDLIVEATRT